MKAFYFKSKDCSVCKAFLPRFLEICEEYNIPYEIVEITENQEKTAQLLVFTVPTIIFLNEENYELIRFSGYFGSYEIKNFLDRYYSTY
ncbi:thioredoxin family protein [Petrotoga sp. 9PWA.NaAc.5.4]|uniref:thioredoxin family protein n=1 Tax=Petrotoga sp. 9PWA.NaAc.5.4 TaxID=1434328 RepID=UPI000CBB8FF4|nr:thioredoxin family protein [Petrotoga sp. 9PWA.NaAc.5.4]PNR97004.1 glutaredoxin [Petrotoga sp. 9PWA.NaAc.5.4]